MDQETAFLTTIPAAPDDEALRLNFADWLEQQAQWSIKASKWNYNSPSCNHNFPYLHRVCDIRLRGDPFRVLRCVQCKGQLRAVRIKDSAWRSKQGVPLSLQGDPLQQWIQDELAREAGEEALDCRTEWQENRQ